MLAQERRGRLVTAMREAGIAHLVLYGNAWQGDYLRYGADFGILEGHGIALHRPPTALSSCFSTAPPRPSAPNWKCRACACISPPTSRARSARGSIASPTSGSPPRRGVFCRAGSPIRRAVSRSSDATALVDKLLMHKSAGEIAAVRRAAQIADEAYAEFRQARCGRAAASSRSSPTSKRICAARGCPDNFMIIGSGGKDVFGMTPPSERRIAAGDLVTTELTPAVEGYFAQICRTLVVGKASEAQRRAFARLSSKPWRRASPRCGPACAPPTWRGPRTTCSANTVSANTPPANGRACAATAWACSPIPSRTSWKT